MNIDYTKPLNTVLYIVCGILYGKFLHVAFVDPSALTIGMAAFMTYLGYHLIILNLGAELSKSYSTFDSFNEARNQLTSQSGVSYREFCEEYAGMAQRLFGLLVAKRLITETDITAKTWADPTSWLFPIKAELDEHTAAAICIHPKKDLFHVLDGKELHLTPIIVNSILTVATMIKLNVERDLPLPENKVISPIDVLLMTALLDCNAKKQRSSFLLIQDLLGDEKYLDRMVQYLKTA